MSSLILLLGFVALLSVPSVNGHSWVHCTDYDGTISGQDFNENKCNGYIRQWSSQWGATSFSTDRGVNYFGSEGNWCQSGFSSDLDSMYDSSQGYGMANWVIGETVTIVWPAKNHANYECYNYIPDTSMKLFYNPSVNPSSQLSKLSDWEVLVDWQDGCTAGQDGCGFQNCPKFCDSTDKAPCFGEYKVSRNDFPDEGYYTIMWYWIFNQGSAPYTTCFEVYVSDDGGSTGGGGSPATTAKPATPSPTKDSGTDTCSQCTCDCSTQSSSQARASATTTTTVTDDTDSSSTNLYAITVDLCYTGAAFDLENVINGANEAFDGTGISVDWSLASETDGTSGGTYGFNVTIVTETTDPAGVNAIAYSYQTDSSEVCDAIEDEFGTGNCEICEPGTMTTTLLEENFSVDNGGISSSSSDMDDAVLAVILGLIALAVVVAGVVFFYVCRRRKNMATQESSGTASNYLLMDN